MSLGYKLIENDPLPLIAFPLYQLLSRLVNNNLLMKFVEVHFAGWVKDLAEM